MKLQVQVWDSFDNFSYRKRTHFEIPCLKKNVLIFSSISVAKSYLKFINRYRSNAYIKLIERR